MYPSRSRSMRRWGSRGCSALKTAIDTSTECWTKLHGPNGRVKSRPMHEFELIDRLIDILGENTRGPSVLLGPGDDASLVVPPRDSLVVSSIDALVADIHFPAGAPADLVGF